MKKNFSLYLLGEREQNEVNAGQEVGFRICPCGCAWANCGGSSSIDNECANWETGRWSKYYSPQNSG